MTGKSGITPSVARTSSLIAVGGDRAILSVPDNYEAGRGAGAVLWLHGSGGNEFTPYGDTVVERNMSDGMLSNGLIVVSPYSHSNTHWGNTQAITDANAACTAAAASLNITNWMVLGQSMGGLHGLLMLADATITFAGFYGVSPVASLQAMYGTGAGTTSFSAAMKAAYGIASDGSDYASKTAGHDPMVISTSNYTGKKLRFVVSDSDTVVVRASHSDAMISRVGGVASEASLLVGTGGHLSADQFRIADFLSFRSRCV